MDLLPPHNVTYEDIERMKAANLRDMGKKGARERKIKEKQ